jgi:hypothetical protein
MTDVLQRAQARRLTAERVLAELALFAKWSVFGRPVLVGAAAYDLVVAPDIDMEIYCPTLRIEHGFAVISQCALHPGVTKARFANELSGRDKALYWQLRYRDGDTEWKIDMWSAPTDYDLPRSEHFVEPMRAALTPETRRAILELKEARSADATLACLSIDLYRAVLEDGIRTPDRLRLWLQTHDVGALTDWKPKS